MKPIPCSNLYRSVISLILERGGDFKNSAEYQQLVGNAEDLPGVVSSAYARYIGRVARLENRELSLSLVEPLNIMSSWNDEEVNTLLLDEVIDQFQADDILGEIEPMLSEDFLELIIRAN